jgi:hypothetical protein
MGNLCRSCGPIQSGVGKIERRKAKRDNSKRKLALKRGLYYSKLGTHVSGIDAGPVA